MYFEDFSEGMVFALDIAVIEKKKMLEFADEYNPVPIHLDGEYAKRTKFGEVIASGMMSYMAVWRKLMDLDPFGEELVAGTNAQITWLAPVFAEDKLQGTAVVSKMNERNPYNGEIILEITAVNQDGVRVFEAFSGAVVRRRPLK
jgi:acyl dehydratase